MSKTSAKHTRREKRQLPVLGASASEPRTSVPCLSCALCCTYVAVPIASPDSLHTAAEILWQLYHEYVSVYRDSDDEWVVQFETRCRHLAADNRCRIYEQRPPICRSYSASSCEVNAADQGTSFYSPESFLRYLERRSPRIYKALEKRYLPSPEQLAPLAPRQKRAAPAFERRFDALRAQRDDAQGRRPGRA